ncbi:MAG: hypothetical protein RLZZ505_2874, partial [Verrucomicrobiota bacterium]
MSAALVFPHQLFAEHPAIEHGRPVFLAEDPLFFGNDKHHPVAFHKQKLVLHRASMRAYADELRSLGHHVEITASYQNALPADLDRLPKIVAVTLNESGRPNGWFPGGRATHAGIRKACR